MFHLHLFQSLANCYREKVSYVYCDTYMWWHRHPINKIFYKDISVFSIKRRILALSAEKGTCMGVFSRFLRISLDDISFS